MSLLQHDIGKDRLDDPELPDNLESPGADAPPIAANFPAWKRFLGSDEEEYQTSRSMRSRHLMMIAIGGTIGTGIFLSAGSSIALAGPGSALLSYVTVGIFVYAVVISL
jgi:amino acid permease